MFTCPMIRGKRLRDIGKMTKWENLFQCLNCGRYFDAILTLTPDEVNGMVNVSLCSECGDPVAGLQASGPYIQADSGDLHASGVKKE